MNFVCDASAFPRQYTHTSFFSFPLSYTFSLCLVLSKISTLYRSLPDNECRNSPSYVFSSAWRLVSAHGPLIINLTLCAGRLIIPAYLYDSDLTSSPGDSVFSLSLYIRLFVVNLQQPRHEWQIQAPKSTEITYIWWTVYQELMCVVQVRIEPLIVAMPVLHSIEQWKESHFWTLSYSVKLKPN